MRPFTCRTEASSASEGGLAAKLGAALGAAISSQNDSTSEGMLGEGGEATGELPFTGSEAPATIPSVNLGQSSSSAEPSREAGEVTSGVESTDTGASGGTTSGTTMSSMMETVKAAIPGVGSAGGGTSYESSSTDFKGSVPASDEALPASKGAGPDASADTSGNIPVVEKEGDVSVAVPDTDTAGVGAAAIGSTDKLESTSGSSGKKKSGLRVPSFGRLFGSGGKKMVRFMHKLADAANKHGR